MAKRGPKTFKPTDKERLLVEQMTAVGIPHESIAMVVRDGIDDKTLRKHFRRELDTAKTKANAKVGGMLFNKIMNGDTTAAIFWAKTQMKWKETNVQENVGKDGGPIDVALDYSKLSDTALAELKALHEKPNKN